MRMKNDENGISTIGIIGIIIIALVGYNYIAVNVDGLTSITDLIHPPDEITISWGIRNQNTSLFTKSTSETDIIYYKDWHTFELELKTNAPYKLTNPYTTNIHVYLNGDLVSGIYQPIGFSALYTDIFTYQLNLDTTPGSTNDYIITIVLYDSNEIAIPNQNYNMYLFPEI